MNKNKAKRANSWKRYMSIAHIEQNILIVNYTTKKITSKQIGLEAIRKKCRFSVLGRILNGLNIEQLDKASKYFTSLESRKYIGRQIVQMVKNDGQVISDQFEILDEIKSFHKNIQKRETIKSEILSSFLLKTEKLQKCWY